MHGHTVPMPVFIKGLREGGWLCLRFGLSCDLDAGDNEAQVIC